MSDEDARDRQLWETGRSAFWLDPDRWYGCDDPRRDMIWMHLDERPETPWGALREPMPWETISTVNREQALHLLSKANDFEDGGQGFVAGMLRGEAIRILRAR